MILLVHFPAFLASEQKNNSVLLTPKTLSKVFMLDSSVSMTSNKMPTSEVYVLRTRRVIVRPHSTHCSIGGMIDPMNARLNSLASNRVSDRSASF